jgi:hypothetical protein
MFSDVHNQIHFTLSFPKDTTNYNDTSNTYDPFINPHVRWNLNKAGEYVQVLENDPNNTLNEINNILNDTNHTMATTRYFDFELDYFSFFS